MKKILCVILAVLSVALTSCNRSAGFGNFEFKKVHVNTYHFSGCIEIKKWYETGSGLEVKTKNFGNLFFSEGTYVMIEEKCPFCDGERK